MPNELQQLWESLPQAMASDRGRLRGALQGVQRLQRDGKPFDRSLQRVQADLERSVQQRAERLQRLPEISYDDTLPVVQRKDEIATAIRDHQVVVVCGETGSGKSTQLPKICLELGRGIDGIIGHTQPRRLAARSVATRVAEELKTPLGQGVGFKIRFTDVTTPNTYIKVM
ncbi:MAG: ATP-dependent RNA helicase HrpA, partial [Planctomycetaceae bacterium]|nr:ATP-dependent RNA helicase HrpA [Planctomycetaceae bacterium]